MQTMEEIVRISEQWQLNDAPDELILKDTKGEFNGQILAQCIADHFNGIYSRANLSSAYAMLRAEGKLLLREAMVLTQRIEAPIQSTQEAEQIRREWWAKLSPKDLPYSANNDAALAGYVKAYFGNLTSITSLNEAVNHAPLQRISAEEVSRIQREKAEARQRKDYLDSIKPQPSFDEHVKAETAKKFAESEAKAEANAEQDIEMEIMGYESYAGPNRRDFTKTAYYQDQLRQISKRGVRGENGRRSARKTLAVVREAKSNMP
jgi:hypothetical protein